MPSPTSSSHVAPIAATGDPLLNALLGEYRWASNTISYSFPEPNSAFSTDASTGYGSRYYDAEPWSDWFEPLTTSDRVGFTTALQAWSNVANITFRHVTESDSWVGDVRAAYTYVYDMADYEAWAYTPGRDAFGGDIWFNAYGTAATEHWVPGSQSYLTALHEIGHAIGLKHPFDAPYALDSAWDVQTYTIMSYRARPGDTSAFFDYNPTTPMLLDVRAIQHAYGANTGYRAGNDTYTFTDATPYHETLWDAGGRDTLVYTGSRAAQIDLNPGTGSVIGVPVHAVSGGSYEQVRNVWIAQGALIENATGGSGDDVLTGNAMANELVGGAGNDRLVGGDGADRFLGGAGNDVIEGGSGQDTALYSAAFGSYTVSFDGTTASVVARTGGDGADRLTGVEKLVFSGGEVALGTASLAAQAYRLYEAAFDRAPDLSGLGYQVRTLESGVALSTVAQHFLESPEFQRTYGSLDAGEFVTQLYLNVLGRAPDQSGLQYHVNRLESGVTRNDVLLGFSESPENQAQVVGAIQNGIYYTV